MENTIANTLDAIALWLFLGVAVQHAVNTIVQLADRREWKGLLAIAFGELIAIPAGFNIVGHLAPDIPFLPIIGMVVTGIGIGGGAALMFDMLSVAQKRAAKVVQSGSSA